MKYIPFLLLFSIFCTFNINGQRISISDEFLAKDVNYYDYFKGKESYLLFMESFNEYKFKLFNENLITRREVEITREKGNVFEGIILFESRFLIFSSEKKNGIHYILLDIYNEDIIKIDTTIVLFSSEQRPVNNKYSFIQSNDGSRSLIYSYNSNSIFYILINNLTLKVDKIFKSEVHIKSDEPLEVHLGNNGDVTFNTFREGANMSVIELYYCGIESFDIEIIEIELDDIEVVELKACFNNVKSEIVFGGFFGDRRSNTSSGHFYVKYNFQDNHVIYRKSPFNTRLIKDLYGAKKNIKMYISDFKMSDILLREDGGVILLGEQSREFLRRSSYPTMLNSDLGGISRGFVDYYYEDIIIFSLNDKGQEDWYNILYKKQFSQDDGGVYSSFSKVVTPSRIHLIFNDEIKSDNTVSEYVLSPSGKYERISLVNTEYKGLQFRFRDGKQISSNEIIVPSEYNYKISLSKIKI